MSDIVTQVTDQIVVWGEAVAQPFIDWVSALKNGDAQAQENAQLALQRAVIDKLAADKFGPLPASSPDMKPE